PALALGPARKQVLHQERRDHHAHPVVHPAGLPELAHAGVDDRIAGATLLPRAQRLGVLPPWERVEPLLQVLARKIGKAVQELIAELAPAELGQEFFDVARDASAPLRREGRGVPDLERADLAEPEMR